MGTTFIGNGMAARTGGVATVGVGDGRMSGIDTAGRRSASCVDRHRREALACPGVRGCRPSPMLAFCLLLPPRMLHSEHRQPFRREVARSQNEG
jgi:hypothetical protein